MSPTGLRPPNRTQRAAYGGAAVRIRRHHSPPGGRSRTGVLELSRRRPRNVTGYWWVSDRAEGQSEVSGTSQRTGAGWLASRGSVRLRVQQLRFQVGDALVEEAVLDRAACKRSSRVRLLAVRSRSRCLSVLFSAASRPAASLSCSRWVSRSWPSSSPMRARWARISACVGRRQRSPSTISPSSETFPQDSPSQHSEPSPRPDTPPWTDSPKSARQTSASCTAWAPKPSRSSAKPLPRLASPTPRRAEPRPQHPPASTTSAHSSA